MAVDLLSPGAISILLSGNYETVMKPVVQVLDIKSRHLQYDTLVLSDGSVCADVDIDFKIEEMIRSKQLQKFSIVQLTQFSVNTHSLAIGSYIYVEDLKVIRRNYIILGDPKPFSRNKTPSVNKFITPKSEEDHVGEYAIRKRQRQSRDNKEDGEIGACFEKLEKLGWEEGPMYDTVVLLFGESSDYRKIWLHLKPTSCVNWVKNVGGKYGLLG